jgi:hypothetical protein
MHGTRRKRLNVESLELRAMMTGNVTAVVDPNGSLRVTGDTENNGIVITQTGDGTYQVAGDATTTINSQTLGTPAVLPGVTRSFNINMSSGNDNVTIQNLTVPKNLRLNGELGNDVLLVSNVTVNGNAIINGGAGADTITATQVRVDRTLSVNGGDDTDTMNVDQSQGTFLLISSRRGKDVVNKQSNDFDATLRTSNKWSTKVADIVFNAWERAYT